jgi:hypothetical protein
VLIQSEDEWIDFFKADLPEEFVVKPARGSHGDALQVFQKNQSGFLSGENKLYRDKEVYNYMQMNKNYDSFVIQERLRNHADLNHLSSSRFLHSLRVITFIDGAGNFNILHAGLMLILGQNVKSNQVHGRTGNLRIRVSIENGTLEYGAYSKNRTGGYEKMTCNPETGLSFEGFKLPLWDELHNIAREAAFAFLPLRNIGWDFAITTKGIVIIEGHIMYEPPNYYDRIENILNAFAENMNRSF